MKKATTAALLTILALSALAAASTPAAEWLCNGKAPANATACAIKGVNLEVVLFKDMSAGSEIECPVGSVTGEGFAGPGAKGEITKTAITKGSCTAPAKAENLKGELVTNACQKAVTIEAENLPWATELITVSPAVQGFEQWVIIKGTGKGEPAYLFECEIAGGIKVDDLCEALAAHPLHDAIENLKADEETPKLPLVDILGLPNTFEANENEWGKCSVGGANSALTTGEGLGEAFEGGKAVSLEADK